MSTLQVTTIRNPASSVANGTLNADGTTTFGGIVTFATGQTFPSASSTLPPASPSQGSTWYDIGVTPPVLKVWNGSAWVPVSNNQSGTAPTSPSTGQQWTDTSTNPPVIKIWNGSGWIPASVAISNGVAPVGPVTGQLWSDTSTTPATLKAWNGGAWVPVQAAGGGGSGTVTSIIAGTGLTGGTITSTGTIALNPSSVIAPTLLTAKGSIISASAASTPVELTTGTNGQVLTVDTTTASGLKWAAAGGSGTVTSVTGTAPIAVATGTTTPVVSITAGTARQLLQTNAGGTAAEFASNIDIPGTLDVTGAAVFDNTVTVAGTHLQLQAQGDLRFADADSSNYVAFQAPATVAANVTWTLPAADGTAGEVLSTDGAGVLSWASSGGGTGSVVAWVNFDGTGTVTIRQSGNVSSITDNGTGEYTVNFTNAMPDTNYAVFGFVRATNAGSVFMSGQTGSTTWQQTNSVRVVTLGTAGGLADSPYAFLSVVR